LWGGEQVDVWYNTTLGDNDVAEEFAEFFVISI
jgi:hypothetical protein